jgi:hypothetical protein
MRDFIVKVKNQDKKRENEKWGEKREGWLCFERKGACL